MSKERASVDDYRPGDMVTEKETAEIIGMSVQFLRHSRMDGLRANRTAGPPYFKIGRSVRYKISDLSTWLDAHRIEIRGATGSE
jgi:hypothetical protein